ncbi:hypothetical protein [Leucobacter sp. W1478]|uniref:hypothetical protein n=1 Tax=Leucobacter sp. W1478 TaxID=3439065 RepID=UPI003F2D8D27
MTEASRRGVTRGYVGGLVFATVAVVLALIVAVWGLLALFSDRDPVQTAGITPAAVPLILAAALSALAWGLWLQAVQLLRGLRTPPWAHTLVMAGGAYLIWCLGGLLAGLSIDDTWLSPYAATLTIIFALGSLLFWAVLARRVFTDKAPPQWPWERRSESGPDWQTGDDDADESRRD